MRNDTGCTYQIAVDFDDEKIIGAVFMEDQSQVLYRATNGIVEYFRDNGKIYESVKVERREFDSNTGRETGKELLYTNKCEICYPLPDGTKILEKG